MILFDEKYLNQKHLKKLKTKPNKFNYIILFY